MEEYENKSQKAIRVEQFGYPGIKCTEIPIKSSYEFTEGDFLAKIISAPLGPLDYWKINGKLPGLACPFTVGSEAYGEIVYCPSNKSYIGKKVAFLGKNGGMQEYGIGNIGGMVEFGEGVDSSVAACGFVNPFTTLGLFDRIKQLKAEAIVSTAGNSQVGRMIIRYGKALGIKVISICRGEANVSDLKSKEGAEYVLDCKDEAFAEKFKTIANEIKATVCVDSLAGDLAGVLFNNMPQNSVLICYGSVCGPMNGIDGFQTRWANKKLEGFVLFRWWNSLGSEEKKEQARIVAEGIKDVFATQIRLKAKFEEAPKLIEQYKDELSGGKIVFYP